TPDSCSVQLVPTLIHCGIPLGSGAASERGRNDLICNKVLRTGWLMLDANVSSHTKALTHTQTTNTTHTISYTHTHTRTHTHTHTHKRFPSYRWDPCFTPPPTQMNKQMRIDTHIHTHTHTHTHTKACRHTHRPPVSLPPQHT